MATIRAQFRNGKIYIAYTHKTKKSLRISTGIKIDKKYWDEKKKWVKKSSPHQNYVTEALNLKIQEIVMVQRQIESEGNEPYPDAVRQRLFEEKEKNPSTETENNPTLLAQFLDEEIETKAPVENTVKRYRTSIKDLKEFGIGEVQLTADVLEKYHNYCVKKYSSDNTIEKRVYFFKSFLLWCYNKNIISWRPDYSIKRSVPDPISLDSHEIQRFRNVQLSDELSECRDIFLFCASTSLAYVDYMRLVENPHWIQNGMILNPGRQKTGTPQNIPLNDLSKSIISKYEGELPVRSSQVLNRNLKQIAKKAEIDKPVTIKRYWNKKAVYQNYAKWELISIHKARKTFATLSLQRGVQPFAVKEIGGWKDWKSMKPYIDKSEDQYLKDQMSKWDNHDE